MKNRKNNIDWTKGVLSKVDPYDLMSGLGVDKMMKEQKESYGPLPIDWENIPSNQHKDLTTYESEFFEITESLCYEFNEDLVVSFDIHFNDKLFANINKFKAEINENITRQTKADREFYLNRILKRLRTSNGITILKNKKTGREYPYLQSTFESIEGSDTTKVIELAGYFRMSNDYKNQMMNFISQLIEPIIKKPDELGNNKNWDTFYDELDWSKYNDKGIALLRRQYCKEQSYIEEYSSNPDLVPVVAKGITAFLSFWSYSSFRSFRLLLKDKEKIDLENFFIHYFTHCFEFMSDEEKRIPFKDERKSEIELVQSHLEKEERLFKESQLFFEEVREWERPIIEKISKAALYYQKWLKETHIKEDSQKSSTKILVAPSSESSDKASQETEKKSDKLKNGLSVNGFFGIPMVSQLNDENKEKLVELISSNQLPYCVAMFDSLGFIKYLMKNHFKTKKAMSIEISKWFDSDYDGRSVRGNIASLLEKTNENKTRYTSYQHKEKVKEDYLNLK